MFGAKYIGDILSVVHLRLLKQKFGDKRIILKIQYLLKCVESLKYTIIVKQ